MIDNFLNQEWRKGAITGSTPSEAYFVKCDKTTMSKNDISRGLLICTIGVSLVRPAEFIVFRIKQKTASDDL
jgi:phage tail sheath protein FI